TRRVILCMLPCRFGRAQQPQKHLPEFNPPAAEGSSRIAPRRSALRLRSFHGRSRATHVACFALIASRNEQSRAINISFVHAPHALEFGRILRVLNGIRDELFAVIWLT